VHLTEVLIVFPAQYLMQNLMHHCVSQAVLQGSTRRWVPSNLRILVHSVSRGLKHSTVPVPNKNKIFKVVSFQFANIIKKVRNLGFKIRERKMLVNGKLCVLSATVFIIFAEENDQLTLSSSNEILTKKFPAISVKSLTYSA
jgi:hypothetical protein